MTIAPVGPGRIRDVAAALAKRGVADIDSSDLARSMYSSDASLFRVQPMVVVRPRSTDEIQATLDACRELSTPLTMRGGGTSIAGNAIGPGVIVDVSRHLNRILEVDEQSMTATVEPGVVQSELQRAAASIGLRFGPDPSTHNRATIGGMIGNNACGSRALGYGRTSDNVLGLDVVAGTGERLALGALDHGHPVAPLLADLKAVVAGDLATIRTEFGRFGRQVSGYSLEHLLPERRFDVARSLVGSEGTLALTTRAKVRLVRDAPVRILVVLGYDSMAEAADATPAILPFRPVACEGLDSRIVDVVRNRRGDVAVPPMPVGRGWLMVELVGETIDEVLEVARQVIVTSDAIEARIVTDAIETAALWRIREDGAGLAARTPAGVPAHSGWEDTAVPPDQLGDYLRDFESLLEHHALTGVPYGHFGDGCVHIRIDFPLDRPGGTDRYREFLTSAAQLVSSRGGSMSGEHGDGRARSELLRTMYSSSAISLFELVKATWDPNGLLNPGVIVRPAKLDADIRLAAPALVDRAKIMSSPFGYSHDRGDLAMAVHRCTGVGKCRASTGVESGTGVMCPSYLATRDEKDSTRGRARVLQDVVAGNLGPDGWRSDAVRDSLDLCLSCKGCASDCPTGVDMATYKAEALYHRYAGRLRPAAHYSLGWLPRWAMILEATRVMTPLVNAVTGSRLMKPLVAFVGGIDRRRQIPAFARRTLRERLRGRLPVAHPRNGDVVLFVDTFTNSFSPAVGEAAVAVLHDAGYRVRVVEKRTCCGLTWISTGQLDIARSEISRTVDILAPLVASGARIVGLEPSCTAVLRGEAVELVDDSRKAAARHVARATLTLAELLQQTPDWSPPDLSGVTGIAQPHCHHHAVMGWDADAELLTRAGAKVRRLGGCCGLAGNFGAEQGHYEISMKVAEQQLAPALDTVDDQDTVLADGFSCRTQIEALGKHLSGVHLAEVLHRHLSIRDDRSDADPRSRADDEPDGGGQGDQVDD